ncbi:MAG: cytochrome P450 [Myxococcota bacterium]
MKPVRALQLEEIDLSTLEFWERPETEREGAFATLREEDPIRFFHEQDYEGLLPAGPGYWSLTKHEHILEASRTPEVFCSGKGATSIPDLPPEMNEFFGGMINLDDPRHGRQRRIISRGFTPRALGSIEAKVEQRAAAVIDRVREKGECDFVAEIAAPLPLEIICDMMGIPESQEQFVFERSNQILGLGDPDYVDPETNPIVAALKAGGELAALMREMAADRRKNPREDLTTALIDATGSEDTLTDEELASFFVLLVVAGNETTRNAVSHGMKALCDFPDERRRWEADFDGLAATAIEEIVRWASPVMFMRRTVTRDTELGGKTLREGDKTVLWYFSGNRDADKFDEPYRFDVGRTPNEHIGFGGPGPHYCLDANLARREIRVMFRQIFERLPNLQITGEPQMLRSNFVHGIKRMPCEWTVGGS